MTKVWFLFAHPDDEFAVTALIKDHCLAGDRVECVYLTNGAFAGQPSAPRLRETLRALARLRVPAEHTHFVGEAKGFSDGALCESLEPALQALLELSAASGCPDQLYCPAWEGGHQDHDALHLLALAFASRCVPSPRLRQYSLYTGDGLIGPWFRLLTPLAANGPAEERIASLADRIEQLRTGMSYPSQWRTWLGLFPFLVWHVLTDGRFRVQAVNPRRVLEAPHSGAPLYERRGFMNYTAFRAAADPFIRDRIPVN